MSWFEKLQRKRVQAALNVLFEAPFFYREDDPDLFAFLRRNRAEFTQFFDELFDMRLVIDARCARLYKTTWHNRALKPSQHDVFELTRRDDCIAFLLVLEFYERLLEEQNVDIDEDVSLRFEFGELFAFARDRLQQLLGPAAPDDDGVRRLLRDLVPTLLRYRFLREVAPDRDERIGLDRDRYLYECLPALHHYDVRAVGVSALRDALGVPPSPSPGDDGEAGEPAEEEAS